MTSRTRNTTGISWTHFPEGYGGVSEWRGVTWNPVSGCTRVSPGCANCYALTLHNQRYAANVRRVLPDPAHGTDSVGAERKAIGIGRDYTWPEAARAGGSTDLPFAPQYDKPFNIVQMLGEKRLREPLHWTKPRAVFVNSMSDLFHEEVTDEFLDRVFGVMALTPQHVYMVLTKRPERMRAYFASPDVWARIEVQARILYRPKQIAGKVLIGPLGNVWLGTSVEDQQRAEERLPYLLDTPAAIHFVSAEPLLGPLDFIDPDRLYGDQHHGGDWDWLGHQFDPLPDVGAFCATCGNTQHNSMHRGEGGPYLDWILVGGESGLRPRPMNLLWVESILAQCEDAGVAYFGKQRVGRIPGLPLPAPLDAKAWPDWRA